MIISSFEGLKKIYFCASLGETKKLSKMPGTHKAKRQVHLKIAICKISSIDPRLFDLDHRLICLVLFGEPSLPEACLGSEGRN
jgi:hypothetical protein